MEASDLKALAGDDQTFRLYVANGLSSLSERVTAISEHTEGIAKEVDSNRDRLIQIDWKGTHGFSDLRDRIAAHDKWLEDVRKGLSDHAASCPLGDRISAVEVSMHRIAEDNAVRAEILKGFDDMKKKVDGLVVSMAENTAAKSQKDSDWRMTITMVGMVLTTIFSVVGLLRSMKVLP